MSKKVKVEIEGYNGWVTFVQPLYLEHAHAIEAAKDGSIEAAPSAFLSKVMSQSSGEVVKVSWGTDSDAFFIPALLKCVEKWELENFPADVTAETFPISPRGKTRKLIDFLWQELENIYNGETEVPNAS